MGHWKCGGLLAKEYLQLDVKCPMVFHVNSPTMDPKTDGASSDFKCQGIRIENFKHRDPEKHPWAIP